jgi:hypothetical protein
MTPRIYDPIRRRAVAATPEELVRQFLLRKMTRELGYPRGLIAVEKEIGELRRRFDIVCYGGHVQPGQELSPLLLIECKAVSCSESARQQAFGYNAALGAPFICIACKSEVHTLWLHANQIASVPFLPSYDELLELAKKRTAHATN